MSLNFNINDFRSSLEKLIRELEERLRSIRGYKLSRDFLENLEVEVYHSKYPLKSLGLVSSLDHLSFRFEPFDPNSLTEIEVSIQNRKMSLTLIKEKNSLIIKFPPMTEEMRKDIVKSLQKIKEEIKIKSRQKRDDYLKDLKQKKESRQIGEDVFYKDKELLDKEIDSFNKKVDEIFSRKEKEILG